MQLELNHKKILDQLPYFVGWGGEETLDLTREAFESFLGRELGGKSVLDIGAGDGRMSCLFALLGACVSGIDVAADFVQAATMEAEKWGVQSQINFHVYSGLPDALPDSSYDIAFTKSVLLLIPDLEIYLKTLVFKLKPGAKVVFIENAYRNVFDVFLRRIIHFLRRQYSWKTPKYMDQSRLELIGKHFDIRHIRRLKCSPLKSRSSGWYLICAENRHAGDKTGVSGPRSN